MAKVGRKLISYDETQALEDEVRFRLENWDEVEQGERPDEDTLFSELSEDYTTIELLWEDCKEHLTEIIQKKNPGGYWRAEVVNFGWMEQDGYNVFSATTAAEFLRQILPRTDCTFHIFNYGRGLAIQNYHHDSPSGNEWYYILPISYSRYVKERQY